MRRHLRQKTWQQLSGMASSPPDRTPRQIGHFSASSASVPSGGPWPPKHTGDDTHKHRQVLGLFRIQVFNVGMHGCTTTDGSYCSCSLYLNIWQMTSPILKNMKHKTFLKTVLCKVSPLPAPVISAPGCPDHHYNTKKR